LTGAGPGDHIANAMGVISGNGSFMAVGTETTGV
jgi:hypothetical protein